jgi:hypothetical protein
MQRPAAGDCPVGQCPESGGNEETESVAPACDAPHSGPPGAG